MLLDSGNIDVRNLLAGAPAGLEFTQIAVGTSNTPVAPTDTAITNPVVKPIATFNLLANGVVQFNASLSATDPAMTIREVGLLNSAGVLCYRKVVPDKVKVAGLTYDINYRIKVQ